MLGQDPLGFGGGDDNLYRYVANDPMNHTDPTGMFLAGLIGAASTAWNWWTDDVLGIDGSGGIGGSLNKFGHGVGDTLTGFGGSGADSSCPLTSGGLVGLWFTRNGN